MIRPHRYTAISASAVRQSLKTKKTEKNAPRDKRTPNTRGRISHLCARMNVQRRNGAERLANTSHEKQNITQWTCNDVQPHNAIDMRGDEWVRVRSRCRACTPSDARLAKGPFISARRGHTWVFLQRAIILCRQAYITKEYAARPWTRVSLNVKPKDFILVLQKNAPSR